MLKRLALLPVCLLAFCLPVLAAAPAVAETVLRRGNAAEPETLDPHRATGLPEAMIFYDLYEGLVVRNAEGRPEPGLAERWTVSPDGKTYTFHLRDDARWSDGTPVTAEDVVWSFRRIVDPAGSRGPNAHYLWVVENAKAISEGAGPADSLGVEAVDDRTVEFRLETPAPYLISLLSFPMLVPLPKAQMQALGADFFQPGNLVSSGAYRLAEAVPQSHVKLVKNPQYRAAEDVRIDTVWFYPTENKETEFRRYRAGELDTTYTLPPTQIPWAQANYADHIRSSPQLGNFYYAFNMTKEPWKSRPGLRAALQMVVDRTLITERITRGGELPATTYISPNVANYDPQTPDWAGWPMEKRIAQAQTLLAEAGYPGGKGLTVDVLFNTDDNNRRVAVALAGLWQQRLGLDTRLTNQEWKVFLDTRRTKGFPGLSRQGYIGAYNDANVFLEFFRSDIGPENPAGYANPAFDRLLDQAAASDDPEQRQAYLQAAERLLLDENVVIPIFTYTRTRLVSPKVQGWIPNPLDVNPTRYLSIAE